MIKNKSAITPVVATAILIVVAVVSVIGFQGWFQTYSSDMFVKTEKDSKGTSNTHIEILIGDQLYFKNNLDENISIKQIKIGNKECNISMNVSPGVQNISLGDCADNLALDSSIGDITIITNKEIYTKKHLFKEVKPLPPIVYNNLLVNYNLAPLGDLYNQNQVLINVSSNETIQSCSLNFNGTINSSFVINGTNCWINQNVPSFGIFNYNVTVVSINNGKNITVTQTFNNLELINWFGDGSDGDILVSSTGVYQDLGSGYQLHPDTTGTEWNSVEDGDMVVINAKNFVVESGVTFTTTNRCRGLMIYATGNVTINGSISMTARGPHANPADSSVTGNTPRAPTDGNAVPAEGLVIRRSKSDWSDLQSTPSLISNAHASSLQDFNGTHNSSDLFYGAGLEAVNSESNQPNVTNGLVIKIPRVGGLGGPSVVNSNSFCSGSQDPSLNGQTTLFGTGGGGTGWPCWGSSGAGGSGTCFSGGAGSGISSYCYPGRGGGTPSWGGSGNNYGGAGAAACGLGGFTLTEGYMGIGNPTGGSIGASTNNGIGGLLIMSVKGIVTFGGGTLSARGVSCPTGSYGAAGGASGGGIVLLMYGTNIVNSPSISVNGGSTTYGGYGGTGSIIGPIKIDP